MVGGTVNSVTQINAFVILVGYISSSSCINMGLIANELKRLNPLVIKKNAQNPVFLNIKSEGMHVNGEVLHKLPTKLLPLTLKLGDTSSKLSKFKRFSRSLWPTSKLALVPNLLPAVPKPVFLPILPNWLHQPKIVDTPVRPDPVAKISQLLGWSKRNAEIYEKLLKLKYHGALSPIEFIRYKNLLIHD